MARSENDESFVEPGPFPNAQGEVEGPLARWWDEEYEETKPKVTFSAHDETIRFVKGEPVAKPLDTPSSDVAPSDVQWDDADGDGGETQCDAWEGDDGFCDATAFMAGETFPFGSPC